MIEHAHDKRGRLTRPIDMLAFALAGNATLTLVSKVTKARLTYRVRASDDGRVHFVGVMTGTDNENAFSYLGIIKGGDFRRTAKSKIAEGAPSAKAFNWFWRSLVTKDEASLDCVEVWHEGRCGRCGRKLTVPASIERGIGPECAEQMEAA